MKMPLLRNAGIGESKRLKQIWNLDLVNERGAGATAAAETAALSMYIKLYKR